MGVGRNRFEAAVVNFPLFVFIEIVPFLGNGIRLDGGAFCSPVLKGQNQRSVLLLLIEFHFFQVKLREAQTLFEPVQLGPESIFILPAHKGRRLIVFLEYEGIVKGSVRVHEIFV